MILVQDTPVYKAFPTSALTTTCRLGGVSAEDSGSQRQIPELSVTQPGNSRGVLLLGLGILCLAPCWAKDSMLASSCSGRGGPGYCSFWSFRDRVASCLIPWLPWAQKKCGKKEQLFPTPGIASAFHSLTERTPSCSLLKNKKKIKQTSLMAKKGQTR